MIIPPQTLREKEKEEQDIFPKAQATSNLRPHRRNENKCLRHVVSSICLGCPYSGKSPQTKKIPIRKYPKRTCALHLSPHFLHFSSLHFRRRWVEAANVVISLIGQDSTGKGGVGFHRHDIFGDGFERRKLRCGSRGREGCDLEILIRTEE